MAKFGFASGRNSIATKQHNTEGGGGHFAREEDI